MQLRHGYVCLWESKGRGGGDQKSEEIALCKHKYTKKSQSWKTQPFRIQTGSDRWHTKWMNAARCPRALPYQTRDIGLTPNSIPKYMCMKNKWNWKMQGAVVPNRTWKLELIQNGIQKNSGRWRMKRNIPFGMSPILWLTSPGGLEWMVGAFLMSVFTTVRFTLHIYIYIYTCVYICIYTSVYIYI
jgi:hypothetical protein